MNLTVDELLSILNSAPTSVDFDVVMSVIKDNYNFCPTQFSNGLGDATVINAQGTNEGSCRIFAFAQLHDLTVEQTLQCFGDYYRKDVLEHPAGNDHGNIRSFMIYGWAGIRFDNVALSAKS